ncbi:MAG: ROK family protein [Candidatus Marinimicrobia bacterium]|nr:ROK family protein [Candidatus Neomarinimicrobiota bacterium]|tara:strand:+ start:1779 stop:2666 length:888 start_codon:yes stop_codon:yes gene_type:complete
MNKIGIDLGGTKIEGILLDQQNQVLERIRVPTQQENGYEAILSRIVTLIKDIQSRSDQAASIGICTPGAIESTEGVLKNSNTVCLNGKPLKDDLESALDCSIEIENDANCFALAEAALGAAKGYSTVFGVIMGSGVGGGIVFSQRIHRGRLFIAGEWGHITLHPNGLNCYCGRQGCVEKYISGTALEMRWNELGGENLALDQIVSKFDPLPDDRYRKWKTEFLDNFGRALATVINIVDPDAIVLGGGVSNIPFLYNEGSKIVQNNIFSDFSDTPILPNQLGDSAGVFGAALLQEL